MAKTDAVRTKLAWYKSQRKKHPGINDAELLRRWKIRKEQLAAKAVA